MHPANLLAPG